MFVGPCTTTANESLEGRFSFSLSTFDPSGKLGQVERAIIASSLGNPIVAVIQRDRILMASPQILPSPFMEDDGTSRFSNVTPCIAIGHSGISADGRVLVAAAQRLAVEHAYTYDENIPIDLFLEELSLLYQEYTMKVGARPFGAILLVAYLPASSTEFEDTDEHDSKPQLFRLDPSGSVISYGDDDDNAIAIVNGRFVGTSRSGLESSLKDMSNKRLNDTSAAQDRDRLSRILEEAISPPQKAATADTAKKSADTADDTVLLPSAIITASLTQEGGLEVERRKLIVTPSSSSTSQA